MVNRRTNFTYDENKVKIVRQKRKIHRCKEHIRFLSDCITNELCPNFTRFTPEQLSLVNWSPRTLQMKRIERVKLALAEQEQKLNTFLLTLSNLISTLTHSFPNINLRSFLSTCDREVKINQKLDDIKRREKFSKLKKSKNSNFTKVTVINESDVTLPPEILEILSKGTNHALGGTPNVYNMLAHFEKFYQRWADHAKSEGMDTLSMLEIKHKLDIEFHSLRKTYTKSSDLKTLNNFLDAHPEISIVEIDKSKDICILPTAVYQKKLEKEFDSDKFRKLSKNPLKADVELFNKLIKTMKPFLSSSTFHKIRPSYGLKRAYGLVKKHKEGSPCRPIISNIGAITSGLESYLLTVLKKFEPSFKYEVNSTKDFKNKLLKMRSKFDPKKHTVVSYDISKMFPSINLSTLIPKICDKIYESPDQYFNIEIKKDGSSCDFPPRNIFENLLKQGLQYFTAFATQNKFYRQLSGCAMGSSTSPVLASILCSFFEKEFIDPQVAVGNVLLYTRYVDDICAVVEKDKIDHLHNILNSWDPDIKFTRELSVDHRLKFLDCVVKYDKDTKQLEIETFFKNKNNRPLQNFQAVTPKSQKEGLLIGEIHRVNNTCTKNSDLEKSLKDLTTQFVQNGYPSHYVTQNIKQVKENGFKTREKDPNIEIRHYLKLDFTNPRCDKIGKKLTQIVRKATPKFKLVVAFKPIRLKNAISHRLKNKIPEDEKAGLCYQFECSCGEKYIGETLRPLKDRSADHCVPSSVSNVRKHFEDCPTFVRNFRSHVAEPNKSNTRLFTKFAKSHFKVVSSNLKQYRQRTLVESYLIKLNNPKLNDQVKFAKTIFL